MESSLRSKFNADFTSEKYAALLRCVNETEKWPADFRISETPIFLTREFTDEVTRAAYTIVDQTRTPEFARHAASAIPLTRRFRRLLETPLGDVANTDDADRPLVGDDGNVAKAALEHDFRGLLRNSRDTRRTRFPKDWKFPMNRRTRIF